MRGPHQLLLNSHRCDYGIEHRAVRVPKSVETKVRDTEVVSCLAEHLLLQTPMLVVKKPAEQETELWISADLKHPC